MTKTVRTTEKYSYEVMQRDLSMLQAQYPGMDRFDFGESAYGKKLVAVNVGAGQRRLLMVGAHHGREYISSAFVMASLEKLLAEGGPPEGVLVTFVPMINPDGVDISIYGGNNLTDSMELLGSDIRAWKANGNGIDLNRHYPALFWKKKNLTNGPASEGFGGLAPAIESEVRAMMELCNRWDYTISATFHSKGEVIIYGDTNTPRVNEESYIIAQRLSRVTGYEIMPVSSDPAVFAGGFENWFRQEYGRPSILMELSPSNGTDIPHDMRQFDELVWNRCSEVCNVLIDCLFLI